MQFVVVPHPSDMCAFMCVYQVIIHGSAVSVSFQAHVQGFGSILSYHKFGLWKGPLESHSRGCWPCAVVCELLEQELDFFLSSSFRTLLISYHSFRVTGA